MQRREFLGLICGGLAWPVAAHAQQQSMPLIGFLSSRSPEESKPHVTGFLRGLEAFGYTDGKTSAISDHLHCQRSVERGRYREPQPSGREHHGHRPDERRAHRETARLAGAASSGRRRCWFSDQHQGRSEQLAGLGLQARRRRTRPGNVRCRGEHGRGNMTLSRRWFKNVLAGWSSKTILISTRSANGLSDWRGNARSRRFIISANFRWPAR